MWEMRQLRRRAGATDVDLYVNLYVVCLNACIAGSVIAPVVVCHYAGKKSMGMFSRDPARLVPKGVPPDKSVGAWPSVQEKMLSNTTGTGNVGISLRGGTLERRSSESESARESPRA